MKDPGKSISFKQENLNYHEFFCRTMYPVVRQFSVVISSSTELSLPDSFPEILIESFAKALNNHLLWSDPTCDMELSKFQLLTQLKEAAPKAVSELLSIFIAGIQELASKNHAGLVHDLCSSFFILHCSALLHVHQSWPLYTKFAAHFHYIDGILSDLKAIKDDFDLFFDVNPFDLTPVGDLKQFCSYVSQRVIVAHRCIITREHFLNVFKQMEIYNDLAPEFSDRALKAPFMSLEENVLVLSSCIDSLSEILFTLFPKLKSEISSSEVVQGAVAITFPLEIRYFLKTFYSVVQHEATYILQSITLFESVLPMADRRDPLLKELASHYPSYKKLLFDAAVALNDVKSASCNYVLNIAHNHSILFDVYYTKLSRVASIGKLKANELATAMQSGILRIKELLIPFLEKIKSFVPHENIPYTSFHAVLSLENFLATVSDNLRGSLCREFISTSSLPLDEAISKLNLLKTFSDSSIAMLGKRLFRLSLDRCYTSQPLLLHNLVSSQLDCYPFPEVTSFFVHMLFSFQCLLSSSPTLRDTSEAIEMNLFSTFSCPYADWFYWSKRIWLRRAYDKIFKILLGDIYGPCSQVRAVLEGGYSEKFILTFLRNVEGLGRPGETIALVLQDFHPSLKILVDLVDVDQRRQLKHTLKLIMEHSTCQKDSSTEDEYGKLRCKFASACRSDFLNLFSKKFCSALRQNLQYEVFTTSPLSLYLRMVDPNYRIALFRYLSSKLVLSSKIDILQELHLLHEFLLEIDDILPLSLVPDPDTVVQMYPNLFLPSRRLEKLLNVLLNEQAKYPDSLNFEARISEIFKRMFFPSLKEFFANNNGSLIRDFPFANLCYLFTSLSRLYFLQDIEDWSLDFTDIGVGLWTSFPAIDFSSIKRCFSRFFAVIHTFFASHLDEVEYIGEYCLIFDEISVRMYHFCFASYIISVYRNLSLGIRAQMLICPEFHPLMDHMSEALSNYSCFGPDIKKQLDPWKCEYRSEREEYWLSVVAFAACFSALCELFELCGSINFLLGGLNEEVKSDLTPMTPIIISGCINFISSFSNGLLIDARLKYEEIKSWCQNRLLNAAVLMNTDLYMLSVKILEQSLMSHWAYYKEVDLLTKKSALWDQFKDEHKDKPPTWAEFVSVAMELFSGLKPICDLPLSSSSKEESLALRSICKLDSLIDHCNFADLDASTFRISGIDPEDIILGISYISGPKCINQLACRSVQKLFRLYYKSGTRKNRMSVRSFFRFIDVKIVEPLVLELCLHSSKPRSSKFSFSSVIYAKLLDGNVGNSCQAERATHVLSNFLMLCQAVLFGVETADHPVIKNAITYEFNLAVYWGEVVEIFKVWDALFSSIILFFEKANEDWSEKAISLLRSHFDEVALVMRQCLDGKYMAGMYELVSYISALSSLKSLIFFQLGLVAELPGLFACKDEIRHLSVKLLQAEKSLSINKNNKDLISSSMKITDPNYSHLWLSSRQKDFIKTLHQVVILQFYHQTSMICAFFQAPLGSIVLGLGDCSTPQSMNMVLEAVSQLQAQSTCTDKRSLTARSCRYNLSTLTLLRDHFKKVELWLTNIPTEFETMSPLKPRNLNPEKASGKATRTNNREMLSKGDATVLASTPSPDSRPFNEVLLEIQLWNLLFASMARSVATLNSPTVSQPSEALQALQRKKSFYLYIY